MNALCPVQGKVKFSKRRNARAAADAHMDRDRVGTYHCPQCRYWHVGHTDIVRWMGMKLRAKKAESAA